MEKSGQVCYGGTKKLFDRGNMRKIYFQFFLEDIAWYTNFESKYNNVKQWSPNEYYKASLFFYSQKIREKEKGILKMERLHLSEEGEEGIWKNVFLKSLCTKIQAFNFKLVHEGLPTLEVIGGKTIEYPDKFCRFCKHFLNINVKETILHIFLECRLATVIWHFINDRLKNAYLDVIELNEANIIYKIGMSKPKSYLISEINWALWKNRCKNVYEGEFISYVGVLKILLNRIETMSKVDKVILSIKVYNKRWMGLNQVIEALND